MTVPLPAFLPIVYRLAARLEQVDLDEMQDDPALAAYVLGRAQGLFGLTAPVAHYRLGAEAEACQAAGDSLNARALNAPPLANILDVTARLANELRGRARVVGVLTGQASLSPLLGEAAGDLAEFYALLGRAYLERGAGLLLVAEAEGVATRAPDPALNALRNVAGFFDVPVIEAGALPPERRLPVARLFDPPDRRWRGADPTITAGEVPADLPAEKLAAWVEALS